VGGGGDIMDREGGGNMVFGQNLQADPVFNGK
jgi:hypothetical protein